MHGAVRTQLKLGVIAKAAVIQIRLQGRHVIGPVRYVVAIVERCDEFWLLRREQKLDKVIINHTNYCPKNLRSCQSKGYRSQPAC